jgi:two-component system sensor histidine kinase KdpD
MNRLAAIRLLAKSELDCFLDETISRLRWATIAALLLISLAQPLAGRTRFPDWMLVLGFAGYNLIADLARRGSSGGRSFAWIAVLDLPAVGVLYLNGVEPGGPLFALVVLAAAHTAIFMTLAGSLLYTGALAVIVVAVEPALPGWSSTLSDWRELSARLVTLAVVGIGMGTVTRRLVTEQAAGWTVLGETERLAEIDRLRSAFVSTVSHELRTPLTAARAGLGLLEGSAAERLATDEQELLANARRNVERLNALIADLLATNQLEAGTLRLDRAPVDLRDIITDAIAAVHPLILSKDQVLELDLDEPLPLRGDPGRLEQVMLNVIVNAHRHTSGGTRIIVSGRQVDREVLVTVRDTGPGIPAADLENIFRRFWRLGTDGGGSGLGLAVSRGIVELHGGTMWAESRLQKGATFCIALPLAEKGAPQ